MTRWHESDNPSTVVRGGTWRVMVWIVVVVVFVGLLSVALWAFGVFSSPIKGQGDAFKTKNSGTNRIAAQERFEDLHADILATDRKLDAAKAKAKAAPDSQVAQTEYVGLTNYCIDVVGDYNAESRKYTAQDFKSIDLPYQIDNTDPATDCKPSKGNRS